MTLGAEVCVLNALFKRFESRKEAQIGGVLVLSRDGAWVWSWCDSGVFVAYGLT